MAFVVHGTVSKHMMNLRRTIPHHDHVVEALATLGTKMIQPARSRDSLNIPALLEILQAVADEHAGSQRLMIVACNVLLVIMHAKECRLDMLDAVIDFVLDAAERWMHDVSVCSSVGAAILSAMQRQDEKNAMTIQNRPKLVPVLIAMLQTHDHVEIRTNVYEIIGRISNADNGIVVLWKFHPLPQKVLEEMVLDLRRGMINGALAHATAGAIYSFCKYFFTYLHRFTTVPNLVNTLVDLLCFHARDTQTTVGVIRCIYVFHRYRHDLFDEDTLADVLLCNVYPEPQGLSVIMDINRILDRLYVPKRLMSRYLGFKARYTWEWLKVWHASPLVVFGVFDAFVRWALKLLCVVLMWMLDFMEQHAGPRQARRAAAVLHSVFKPDLQLSLRHVSQPVSELLDHSRIEEDLLVRLHMMCGACKRD